MPAQQKTENAEVIYVQGNNRFLLNAGNNTVSLKKETFSIEFMLRKSEKKETHYARFVADTAPTYFEYMKPGMPLNDTPMLADGTSMATTEDNHYHSLYLIKDGNHNFFYESETENRGGAVLLGKYPKKILRLRWNIADVYEYAQTPYPFSQLKQDVLYMIVYIDKNSNYIIDEGEYYNVIIRFDAR